MLESPSATVVIPTRGRAWYLDVALASIVPQARDVQAEVVVVEDGGHATREVADRHGVTHLSLGAPRGINSARNAGVAVARGPLVVFCDDDVRAAPGWLAALLDAAGALPDVGVFGGPIMPAIDGGGPRSCGREGPVISALDLGTRDRDCEFVWGANMAIRGSALDRVGPFDVALDALGCGDEEDWERRYHRLGGRVRYVAGAQVEHLRMRADARMTALARAAFRRGKAARAYDRYKGMAPTAAAELRTLAGCVGHTLRYRCQNGLLVCAHAGGRVADAAGGVTARTRRVTLVVREVLVLPRLPAAVAVFYVRSWVAAMRSGDRFTLDSATRPSDVAVLVDVARGQRRVVELGTGTAWTTIALALADRRRTVVSCDPVVRAERERYLRLAGRRARARIELRTEPAESAWQAGDVGLVFVDCLHDRPTTLAVFRAWSPLVAAGGAIAFHDYGHPLYPGISEAIDELELKGEHRGGLFVWREAAPAPVAVLEAGRV